MVRAELEDYLAGRRAIRTPDVALAVARSRGRARFADAIRAIARVRRGRDGPSDAARAGDPAAVRRSRSRERAVAAALAGHDVDLVVLSEVRWGYFRTRKQFLLSRFPDRWRIFFAQPPARAATIRGRRAREGNVTYFTVPFLKPGTTAALYNALVDGSPSGAALNERVAERYLSSQLRRARRRARAGGDGRPTSTRARRAFAASEEAGILRLQRQPVSVLRAFRPGPGRTGGARSSRSDALFVVSEHYRRQLAAETDRPLVTLGNGVEVDAVRDRRARCRPTCADCRGHAIGYVGLLSHFLDFETLEALRRSRRGGTLVLIGPGLGHDDQAVDQLARARGRRGARAAALRGGPGLHAGPGRRRHSFPGERSATCRVSIPTRSTSTSPPESRW